MKTCFPILLLCLTASTAAAQLLPARDADKPADQNNPRAANQPAGAPAGQPGAPVGAGAFRGPAGPMPNPMFAAIDTDGDGVITRAELKKAIVQLRKLDTDKDGNLTLAEASPPGGPVAPAGIAGPGGQFGDPNQMIDQLMRNDQNGDGKLTMNELPGQMAQQMIQNGDKDGDGALSRQEIGQAMQEMQARFAQMQGGAQGWPGNFPGAFPGGGAGAGNASQRQMMGQLLQYDRNGDGKLSSDELPRNMRGVFQEGDQNGDGVVDPMEMRLLIERGGDRLRGALGRGRFGQDNAAQNDNQNGDGKRRDRRADRDQN